MEAKELLQLSQEVIEQRIELAKLKAAQKGIQLSAQVSQFFLRALLFLFSFLFAGWGLALWLGELWESPWIGFFFIAGFLFLIFLLIIAFKKRVIHTLQNVFTQSMFQDEK